MPNQLFDGPFLAPLRESDRWPGKAGTHQVPERQASGNLNDAPQPIPAIAVPSTPFKNLRSR